MTTTDTTTPIHPRMNPHPGPHPHPGLPPDPRRFTAQPRQLTKAGVAGVWAAAAVPMALLMWVAAPVLSHHLHGPQALTRAMIICIAAGLVWQFVLTMTLVAHEQHTLRWSTVRDVLWLRSPRSPRTGRIGGRVWWVVVPLLFATAAEEMLPKLPHPLNRDFGHIMQSETGQHFLRGSWMWFAVLVVMFLFNTVFGEELLFRGYLLPRMEGVFGRRTWLANGVIFAAYHLHVPWMIPAILFDAFILAWPVQRYRSAWIGIAVHSAQSVMFTLIAVGIVLK